MGNAPVTIGVKIGNEKNGAILAGSILRGTIFLSNTQSDVVNAESIQLKLVGTEEAVVHYTTSETDSFENFRQNIYSIDHTIKNFPGGVVPKGQFEYPFALHLPKSLPSSMKASRGQSNCEVRYEVIAELYKKPNTIFYKNQHAKEIVTVVALPSRTIESATRLPVEIIPMSNCSCCCCCSCHRIGTMALEAKFDKSTLLLDSPTWQSQPNMRRNQNWRARGFRSDTTPSKSFGVQFRCQNKSKARVKMVRAKLTETIEWTVNGRTEKKQTTLATSTNDASQYPELDAWWRNPLPWEEHSRSSNIDQLLERKPWRKIDPPLGVQAAQATDSYCGGAIEVRHVLTVSVITQGCCTTNPDASTIVNIYRNPVAFGAPAPQVSATSYDPFRSEIESHQTFDSSALYEYEPSEGISSSPFDQYFDSTPSTASSRFQDEPQATAPSSVNEYNSALEVPLVQAQPLPEAQLVLPEDWNAHKAELVTIPIAEATLIKRRY